MICFNYFEILKSGQIAKYNKCSQIPFEMRSSNYM